MSVYAKAVPASVTCVIALAVIALLGGCGQKGPLYREAAPAAAQTTAVEVQQGEQNDKREPSEALRQQPVEQ